MAVKIELQGELGKGIFAIVDEADEAAVRAFAWYISWHKTYYRVVANKGRRQIKLHHLIVGKPPEGLVTDHINGDTLDNRRENLRFISQRANMAGAFKNTKGYYFDKSRGLWAVSIGVAGKRINGGRFKTEEQAAQAAYDLRVRLQGDICR